MEKPYLKQTTKNLRPGEMGDLLRALDTLSENIQSLILSAPHGGPQLFVTSFPEYPVLSSGL